MLYKTMLPIFFMILLITLVNAEQGGGDAIVYKRVI